MLETVEEVAEDWRVDDIKGLLGRCNFKTEMLDRKVSFLSGGEKVILNYLLSLRLILFSQHIVKTQNLYIL